MTHNQDSHVFKFIYNSKQQQSPRGIRTFPQHTYGVSKQSPDSFKHKHTFINQTGYIYKHENNPNFQYHSQQKSRIFDHFQKQHSLELTFGQQKIKNKIQENAQEMTKNNPFKFHLKKGRLTQFYDKNSWMKKVYLMSGFQRDAKARQESNKQRQSRISSLQLRKHYEPQTISHIRMQRCTYKTAEEVMSQKTRIRSRRRQENQRKLMNQTFQRSLKKNMNDTTISFLEPCTLESNKNHTIQNSMSKTIQQWFPRSKGKALRKDSNISVKPLNDLNISYDLQQWQRKTSQSIWNNNRLKRNMLNQQEQQLLKN